jgi:ABC-type glycerol-3-phosphate transport system substrate-binding protein
MRKYLLFLIITLVITSFVGSTLFAGKKEEAAPSPAEEAVPLVLEGAGLAPVTDEPVIFKGWTYKPEIVEDNVNRYNTEMGGHVDYTTIAGDYPTLIETQLVAKEPLDIIYAFPEQAIRYYEGGWVVPADNLPNIGAIKADMYPNVLNELTYKGKLLGLSYFISVRGLVMVNLKAYKKLGFTEADYPATWDELYDQLYEFKDKGMKHAFLPWWVNDYFGAPWAFVWEVLDRGGMLADPETHQPMVTVDGPAGDTLRDWKRILNDGLVAKEVLGYSLTENDAAFCSGEYIYSPQQSYDIKRYNDPLYSKFAGYCDFLPYQGHPWGSLNPALYLMVDRPRNPEFTGDVMRFWSWYGWKDQDGKTFVGQRWVRESALFSAYKSVMESPESEALFKDALANPDKQDALLEVYKNALFPKGVQQVVWGPQFLQWLAETLQKFLVDDLPVDKTIEDIGNKIDELNTTYGVGG